MASRDRNLKRGARLVGQVIILEIELREIRGDVLLGVEGLSEAFDPGTRDPIVREVQLFEQRQVCLRQALGQPTPNIRSHIE